MLQYRYTPDEANMEVFPPGHIRLAGVEETRDPLKTDCFVLPCDIRHIGNEQLLALPYLKGNIKKHVFFTIGENPDRVLPFDGAIVFRTDNNKGIMEKNPSTMTWAWGVQDSLLPPTEFKYDVCFQGWRSTELTDRACESILKTGLKSHISVSNRFYGHIETDASNGVEGAAEERDSLRASFLQTMAESRLSLVPRSKPEGVARWRFYEAMSAKRISVHLCDGFVPPLPDKIDWDKCQFQIAEKDVDVTGYLITEFLSKHTDEDLRENGEYSRSAWLRWLQPATWEQVWAELVKEKLNVS